MPQPPAWVGPRPQKLKWDDLYLRLSVTDACNLRCSYCRPVLEHSPEVEREWLSFNEIVRLIGWCHKRGARKVRITGGEPLLRPGISDLIARIKAAYPDVNLSLSTNGLRLAPVVHELQEAGLDRVNISLDTLDRKQFKELTGVDGLPTVLEAVDASLESGLDPVKVNVVLLRGVNENGLADLVRFALGKGIFIRFIEYMPHCKTETNRFEVFSSSEALEILRRDFELTALPDEKRPIGSGPARYWSIRGSDIPIGLISSVTEDICQNCNRLRVTAGGNLVRCIQENLFEPIRDLIRENRETEFCALLEAAYEKRASVRNEGHVFFLGRQLVQTGG